MASMLQYYFVKFTHCFLGWLLPFVFGLTYGENKELPPITNHILLEPAWKLAEKIRKKQIKCVDVMEAYISRIKDVQPIINAVVDERFDDALAEAKEVDQFLAKDSKTESEIEADTPLLGIPFTAKDIIPIKGLSFTFALVARKGNKALDDADSVKLMRKAGAIPVAATNVPELSVWHETGNRLYGTTCNPYDVRRGCGGSSGGEGALVAAAGSVIGIGNDMGGSVRMPAFMNGLFSHKPSRGVVCNCDYMLTKDIFQNMLSTGPICRYASDLLPVMKVLTSNQENNVHLDKPVDFRKLKIIYALDNGGGNPIVTPVHPDIKDAIKKAARYFEEKYEVPAKQTVIKELEDSYTIWYYKQIEVGVPRFTIEMANGKGEVSLLWELIKWCFRRSEHTLAAIFFGAYDKFKRDNKEDYEDALKKCKKLEEQFQDILDENTVFLYPTHPEPAPFHHDTVPKMWNIGYTSIFNALGLPSSQVPISLCEGLPIGFQVIGSRFNDHLTIAVAVELEKAFGGWTCPAQVL